MMKNRMLWAAASLMVAAGLVACGGSGSGDSTVAASPTPTATGTAVNLSVIKNFAEARTPGSSMTFDLAGSSNTGVNYVGSVSLTISAPTTTLNVLVQKTVISAGNAGSAAGTATSYYYPNGELYEIVRYDGTISTPTTTQTLLPSSAKVGDSGPNLELSISSDGTTETRTWRIDADTNGNARFVFIYTDTNSLNAVIYTEEDAYTIKPDGSITAMSITYSYPTLASTVTLSGNKI
jgi:predicted membrane-bound mannosyltransferase